MLKVFRPRTTPTSGPTVGYLTVAQIAAEKAANPGIRDISEAQPADIKKKQKRTKKSKKTHVLAPGTWKATKMPMEKSANTETASTKASIVSTLVKPQDQPRSYGLVRVASRSAKPDTKKADDTNRSQVPKPGYVSVSAILNWISTVAPLIMGQITQLQYF